MSTRERPSRAQLLRLLAGQRRLLGDVPRLEPYQVAFLQDTATMRAVLKSRQVGFSWLFALEAVISVCTRPKSRAIFVSLNREEAQEKVLYAREIVEALPEKWRPQISHASRLALEFADGSRITSHPCTAPRGRSAADVYLDELAFYRDDLGVYRGALPVISRGGRLVLASTPFGQRGVFWSQCRASMQTGKLHVVPWWRCSWLCVDPGRAAQAAEELDTPARVARFGTDRLKEIYEAMDLEGFQQEYECAFVDAQASWIPYEEIMPCVVEQMPIAATAAGLGQVDGELFAGFDVGRRRNASELVVLERAGGRFTVRMADTLRQAEYRAQKQCLEELMSVRGGVVRRLCIDATGLGANLAEDLARAFPMRVEPVLLTAGVKESLAVALRIAFQNRDLLIPADREFIAQVHAVRRVVTAAGHARFDADDEGASHADKFWALALALHAGLKPRPQVTARRL